MIKSAGVASWKALATRFNKYLKEGTIPSQWERSNTILLYKKGDKEHLKNYRPICLLSHIYMLFTKIVVTRLSNVLDYQQPRQQASFRKNYSTMDHIFTLTQLFERAGEYKLPLCVAFVDYEKAFDSVEINAVLNSLHNQGIAAQYINLLKEANSYCTTDTTGRHNLPETIHCMSRISHPRHRLGRWYRHQRRVSQPSSVCRRHRTHPSTTNELQAMLTKLSTHSAAVGLKLTA
ncbi:putative transposon TX1, partial [Toxocara canis]